MMGEGALGEAKLKKEEEKLHNDVLIRKDKRKLF